MKITYKGKELEVQEPIKIEELLKKEIDNSKYKVVGCIFNNEYQNLEYEIKNYMTINNMDDYSDHNSFTFISTGLKDDKEQLFRLLQTGSQIDKICIDIANGYIPNLINLHTSYILCHKASN